MAHNEQLDKIINEDGFIAALDQSGGSTPKALLQYDVDHSYYKNDTENFNQCMKRCKDGVVDPFTNQCRPGDNDCLSGNSNETQKPLTEAHKREALKAAAAAGVQIPGTIPETFSNYTLDNAADYPNLKSTLTMLDTNENIKRSMRAAEYAKTAPAGSTLMTNHLDTVSIINKQSPLLAGM